MKNIRELRKSTQLTQKEFAEKYSIPLSTLRKWEQGETCPPYYLVKLIEQSLPVSNNELKKIVSRNNKIFYIDIAHKRVSDSLGNWISFHEDYEDIIESNAGIYLEKLFNGFYELVHDFDKDLYFDKKEKVIWR